MLLFRVVEGKNKISLVFPPEELGDGFVMSCVEAGGESVALRSRAVDAERQRHFVEQSCAVAAASYVSPKVRQKRFQVDLGTEVADGR